MIRNVSQENINKLKRELVRRKEIASRWSTSIREILSISFVD